MKTAVSIPDDTFDDAEKLASKRGISRSQLYADALKKAIKEDRDVMVAEQLADFYKQNPDLAEGDPAVLAQSVYMLRRQDGPDGW